MKNEQSNIEIEKNRTNNFVCNQLLMSLLRN